MSYFNSAQQKIPNTEKYIFMLIGATSNKGNFSLQVLQYQYWQVYTDTMSVSPYHARMLCCHGIILT